MTSTTTALNAVDYFVLFTFGLSMLAGYIRGFLKEIISLASFVAASILSTLFAGKLAAMFSGTASASMQGMVDSVSNTVGGGSVNAPMSVIAVGVSFAAIFMATLFVGYIVGTLVTGIASGAGESLSNRFLGALFGGARGFVLVIVLMFIAELTPMATQPAWQQSQFVQSFHPIVMWVTKLVDPSLEAMRAKAESAMQNLGGQMPNVSGAISSVLSPAGQ
jgi:membrane protein required for colicin V production